MKTLHRIGACALYALTASAWAAPTITGLGAGPKSVAPGEAVTFTVKGEGLEDGICALRLAYGDGSGMVRHMDWGKNQKFPLVLKKTYAKPGQYSVSVAGVKSGKVLKCLGSARATVHVVEAGTKP
jgi:hypothetical protein